MNCDPIGIEPERQRLLQASAHEHGTLAVSQLAPLLCERLCASQEQDHPREDLQCHEA
jgi:hypothetical protein